MLQIVLKRKFFIKRPLSHQLLYIKLLFKMHALYKTDVQNIQLNNRLNHYKKQRKSIFSALTTIGGMSCLKVWTTCTLHVCNLLSLNTLRNFTTFKVNTITGKYPGDNVRGVGGFLIM